MKYLIALNLFEPEGHGLLAPRGFVGTPIWVGWALFSMLMVTGIVWYKIKKVIKILLP